MACDCYGELISAYADGELTSPELRLLNQHLAVCDACQAELEQVTSLKLRTAQMAPAEPDEAMFERLRAAVLAEPVQSRERSLRWGLVAAASVLATLCAYAAFASLTSRPPAPVVADNPSDEVYVTSDPGMGAALPVAASFERR